MIFLITSRPLKQCNKSHLSCRDSFYEECFQSAIVILQVGHPIVSKYQLKKNVAHFITLLCRTSGDAVTIAQLHSLSRLKQQALWLEISGEHTLRRERRVPTPLANCLSKELPATPKPFRWQGKPMNYSCTGSLHSNLLLHLETDLGRPTCLWLVTPGGPEGKGNGCRRALTPLLMGQPRCEVPEWEKFLLVRAKGFP